jgi:hypothetical protein
MTKKRWYQNPETTRRVVRHIAKRLHEGHSITEIQEETKLPSCVIEVVARSPLAPRPPDDPVAMVFEKQHSRPIFVPVVLDTTG